MKGIYLNWRKIEQLVALYPFLFEEEQYELFIKIILKKESPQVMSNKKE